MTCYMSSQYVLVFKFCPQRSHLKYVSLMRISLLEHWNLLISLFSSVSIFICFVTKSSVDEIIPNIHPQWDILGLISSSFGAQKKCGHLKKRPHFDQINVVKMWSFYFSGSFGAHFGLIWGSRKCGQNVVIMWSKCGLFFRHENLIKMWSKCGHNVVKMWSKCGLFLRRI